MPAPRFTIVQLFLAATLIALLLGLFTAAARLGPRDKVCQLCFSPNGKLIAARYETGVVKVWRLDADQPRPVAAAFQSTQAKIAGRHWLTECMYFADDNRLVKVESRQPRRVNVRELEIATGEISELLRLPLNFAQEWNVTVRGERLYVTEWGTGNVLCCNLKERVVESQIAVSADPVYALRSSVDGRVLAASEYEGTVIVADAEAGKVIHRFDAGLSPFNVMGLSPDGSKLIAAAEAAVSREGMIQNIAVWNTISGEVEKWPTSLERRPVWLAISRDGQRLAIADQVGAIEFYDLTTMKLLHRIAHDALVPEANWLELSPDGKTLASSGSDRVMLWDIATGKLLHAFGGSESRAAPIVIFTAGFALWAAAWGLVRKRARKAAASSTIAMPFAARLRPILVGLLFLIVTTIVLIELTANKAIVWRDVRVWLDSLSPQEVGSLIALPLLVAVLVRHMAQRRISTATSEPVSNAGAAEDEALSPPLLLKLCWLLMVVGGVFAILLPVSSLFLNRENMLWTAYYSLLAGVLAISRGASRDTHRLSRTVAIQAINIIALDVFNLLLAGCEWFLLRRASVKRYLSEVGAKA